MVKELFAVFEAALDNEEDDEEAEIMEEISAALEAHATVEEEIFYPAVKRLAQRIPRMKSGKPMKNISKSKLSSLL
jgi:hypothetical protein